MLSLVREAVGMGRRLAQFCGAGCRAVLDGWRRVVVYIS
jgi:hypothetical protein